LAPTTLPVYQAERRYSPVMVMVMVMALALVL
jgi:hypothetical protein